jgi:hypothetical protein
LKRFVEETKDLVVDVVECPSGYYFKNGGERPWPS